MPSVHFILSLFSVCFLLIIDRSIAEEQSVCEVVQSGKAAQEMKATVPVAGEKAGTYFKVDSAASNITACILSCCNSSNCHVAFLFNGQDCFKISCLNQSSCEPVPAQTEKHLETIYVRVREPPYIQQTERQKCQPDLKQCPINEHCKKNTAFLSEQGYCECEEGYIRSNRTNLCEIEHRKSLNIEIDGPEQIQLPRESVQFLAHVDPQVSDLTYYWEVLEGEGLSYVGSYAQSNLTLTQLKPGTLIFRITVSNAKYNGQKEQKLVVLSEQKPNKPPVALIRPKSPVKSTTGNQVVLDAEGSSDEDGKIISYEWQLLKGPSVALPVMNTATLTLEHLSAGKYSFGLKVIDDKGVESHAVVEVDISEARDDPPTAVASQCSQTATGAVTVRLPLNSLYLCGNASKDDKGIVSYNWFRVDDLASQLPLDQTGSNTPVLELKGLQSNEKYGPYQFRLEVTDQKGQKDETTMNIFVNKAENQRPQPDAGQNLTVELPENSVVLDGNVKDDGNIVSYRWTQMEGPNVAVFANQDKSKATISSLQEA